MVRAPTIATERLVIRAFGPEDAGAVQRLASDQEVAAGTARIPHPYPDGAAAAWIVTHADERAAGRSLSLAVVRRNEDVVIGAVSLLLEEGPGEAELGYWIGRPHWGRGYATEAAAALIAHGFDRLGLQTITAHHFLTNAASGRVIRKLGFREEGTAVVDLAIRGGRREIALYAIGRAEYDAGMSTTTDTHQTYTAEQIAELLPEIMEIGDTDLRDRVAAVWSEALATGCGGKGWTFDELRAVKFTLLAGDIDLTFVDHVRSCAKQCTAITAVLTEIFGDKIPINRDILIAGALLADVGKPLEYDRDSAGNLVKGHYGEMLRHPFSGVAMCYKHGIPPEVMHIVATHSHEGEKVDRSIESIIFHHADFVDFDIAKYLGKRAAK